MNLDLFISIPWKQLSVIGYTVHTTPMGKLRLGHDRINHLRIRRRHKSSNIFSSYETVFERTSFQAEKQADAERLEFHARSPLDHLPLQVH